jgi:Zn-dependent protease with chaperone function
VFNGTEVSVLLQIVSLILFPLIFTPLACIWMKRIQQNYEYEADDFACNEINNPLRIESVFKQARYHSTNNKKRWQKIFDCIICKKHSHPSDEDRISRMKQNHDEIILLE